MKLKFQKGGTEKKPRNPEPKLSVNKNPHKEAFKSMLKEFGWKYKDVADITGMTESSIKAAISQREPSWLKLAMAVHYETEIRVFSRGKRQLIQDLKNISVDEKADI